MFTYLIHDAWISEPDSFWSALHVAILWGLGLFLDLQVAVAQHLEQRVAHHGVAGEQPVDEHLNEVLQPDKTDVRPRQPDESPRVVSQRQQRPQGLLVGAPPKMQRHREAEIGDERERVGRVDGQRRQHRIDEIVEMALEPYALVLGQAGSVDHLDSVRLQRVQEGSPALLLVGHQHVGLLIDRHKLLGGRAAVQAPLRHAPGHLGLQTGDTHHVELVQVAGRDRQEAQPLQNRMQGVERFVEHTLVESQPRDFAVDEALRRLGNVRPFPPRCRPRHIASLGQRHRCGRTTETLGSADVTDKRQFGEWEKAETASPQFTERLPFPRRNRQLPLSRSVVLQANLRSG